MLNQNLYETKTMAKKLTIKNNTTFTLNGIRAGKTGAIDCDETGMPLDKYWRNRLRDAQIDGCVEILKSKTKKKEDK